MIHQRHRQTDRQRDRRTDNMRSQYRALHYSASRGKNGWTDFHDVYLKRRGFAQGCAFWGFRWRRIMCPHTLFSVIETPKRHILGHPQPPPKDTWSKFKMATAAILKSVKRPYLGHFWIDLHQIWYRGWKWGPAARFTVKIQHSAKIPRWRQPPFWNQLNIKYI